MNACTRDQLLSVLVDASATSLNQRLAALFPQVCRSLYNVTHRSPKIGDGPTAVHRLLKSCGKHLAAKGKVKGNADNSRFPSGLTLGQLQQQFTQHFETFCVSLRTTPPSVAKPIVVRHLHGAPKARPRSIREILNQSAREGHGVISPEEYRQRALQNRQKRYDAYWQRERAALEASVEVWWQKVLAQAEKKLSKTTRAKLSLEERKQAARQMKFDAYWRRERAALETSVNIWWRKALSERAKVRKQAREAEPQGFGARKRAELARKKAYVRWWEFTAEEHNLLPEDPRPSSTGRPAPVAVALEPKPANMLDTRDERLAYVYWWTCILNRMHPPKAKPRVSAQSGSAQAMSAKKVRPYGRKTRGEAHTLPAELAKHGTYGQLKAWKDAQTEASEQFEELKQRAIASVATDTSMATVADVTAAMSTHEYMDFLDRTEGRAG